MQKVSNALCGRLRDCDGQSLAIEVGRIANMFAAMPNDA